MAGDGRDGFLSRWSRRKLGGEAPAPEPTEVAGPEAATPEQSAAPAPAEVQAPPPTLDEAQALTVDSDFKRFLAPDVAPEVRNVAVKKLFADPRYNVRDMMDVYADDYSLPDPIPESMMRKLASAQFLNLFEERDDADDGATKTVAQSQAAPEAVPEPTHADADLRLQPNDAPAGEEPGQGVERGTPAPHDPVPPGSGELPEGDPR
jgi:hypothetical protein